MTRFLFYTDSHLAGSSPQHRADNFPETMTGKLREVYSLAASENCEFVAFGGDFFNSHRLFSYEVIDDTIDIIRDSGLTTYAVVGEHDLYGHSPSTYPSSTLAHVVRRCPAMVIIREPIDLGGVVLHPKHEADPVEMIIGQGCTVDPERCNVLVCHELLTNQSAPFSVTHTSTLAGSPFDLVASGDLHMGYPTHEVDGTWFVNPGALARRATDNHWWPSVALINIEKGKTPEIETRKLECAKPYDEVFSESIAEIVRVKEDFDGDDFTEEMLKFEAESVDVHDLIQKLGTVKGIRKAVLDYLATKKSDAEAKAA